LALDQFKRCVSSDLSLFMVSRPPGGLDEAVQLCCEYTSTNTRGRKINISAADCEDRDTYVTAPEARTLTQEELKNTLEHFQESVSKCITSALSRYAASLQPQRKNQGATPNGSNTQPSQHRKRQPSSPCYLCNKMHWTKDCPQRKQSTQPGGSAHGRRQGNDHGPQQ
jgi:hypothetical protein